MVTIYKYTHTADSDASTGRIDHVPTKKKVAQYVILVSRSTSVCFVHAGTIN